jgi:hypothetical protein
MGVDMGEFDEAEDRQGGDGATGLVRSPGAEREGQTFSQERPAILSEHLPTDLTDAEARSTLLLSLMAVLAWQWHGRNPVRYASLAVEERGPRRRNLNKDRTLLINVIE